MVQKVLGRGFAVAARNTNHFKTWHIGNTTSCIVDIASIDGFFDRNQYKACRHNDAMRKSVACCEGLGCHESVGRVYIAYQKCRNTGNAYGNDD